MISSCVFMSSNMLLTPPSINFSHANNRYRVAEIRYHRVSSSMKSRIESVLLFVPDVWSCVPTASQWENIIQSYMQPTSEQAEADPETKASMTNFLFHFSFTSYFLPKKKTNSTIYLLMNFSILRSILRICFCILIIFKFLYFLYTNKI